MENGWTCPEREFDTTKKFMRGIGLGDANMLRKKYLSRYCLEIKTHEREYNDN